MRKAKSQDSYKMQEFEQQVYLSFNQNIIWWWKLSSHLSTFTTHTPPTLDNLALLLEGPFKIFQFNQTIK